MKYIYILLTLLVSQTNYGQDPQLFENTWYLRSVQLDDLAPIYTVSEIDPPITPFLIISEDYNFNGEGACNNFNGAYNFFPPNNLLTTGFVATTEDCGIPIHNLFENSYFWYISNEFWFDITEDGGGRILTLGNPLGGIAIFRSNPLSTKDFYQNEFTVFPNPANDVLILRFQTGVTQLTIKILNMEDKVLNTHNLEFKKEISLDVSNLSSGIYFLNIEDEKGNTTVKKFIKE